MTGTSEEEVARIAALGVPVLLPDTCFLLDAIRDPTRTTVRPNYREAAAAIVDAMTAGEVVGFIAPQVKLELNDNRNVTETEAADALIRLVGELKRMDHVLRAYGGSGTSDIAHLCDHGPLSQALLDRWLPKFIPAEESDDVSRRAVLRVNLNITPARKGNASIKDCVVTETYLDIAADLRAHGLAAPIVFASSNTKDYCETTGSALKSDLAEEFTAKGLLYAPNFGAARHYLGI